MKLDKLWKPACGAGAALFTLAAAAGIFYKADASFVDSLCQKRQAADERIVVVGIDEYALETLGPFQTWGRGTMAQVLEYLNSDETARPAVIGLDVLYAGETDPDGDRRLAGAAAAGNVVVAAAGQFGSSAGFEGEDGIDINRFSLLSFDQPYDQLKAAAVTGHINAMYDGDGIMRHALLEITAPDGETVPSFALAIAETYKDLEEGGTVRRPPTDSIGFWYLNYTGKPGDYYESISVADLVEGTVPADYFAGKIVLIGPYAAGLTDSYVTAIDHAVPMYGVEIQANAIRALLDEDYKTELPDGPQLAFLFAILFLTAVWFRGRKTLPATAVWLTLTLGDMALGKLLYQFGLVIHMLWIPLGITVLFVISVAANYMRAALEKRQLTSTFKRYVAPEIVDEILRQGAASLELGGRLCDITVLFVDIRGFTTMSEVLTPQQVVEILNRYLTLTSSCIMKHGGTLDKFVGDATMAFWGAPLPQEDAVMKAVQAALDMTEGSKALSLELKKEFGRTVSFGIGIHMGPAVVGNVGALNRMDYTAIGDTVNTASRLESNAPGGTIYISRAVADALEGRIRVTSLGSSIKLKGKAEGFEVLKLDGLL